MNKIVLFLAFSISLLFARPNLTPEVKLLIKEAKSKVKSISATALKKKIENKESIILIDVRDPNEWEKGTIEADNVVKISRGFLEVKYPKLILKKYKKNDSYVVYCAIEPRSILAASRLKELGFKKVMYLKGGYKNWKNY